jgi:tetratricopeptide (TPR) repeat protein
MYKRLLGDNYSNSNIVTSLDNLANLDYKQGRYSEAEPLYIEALAMRKRLLGENHPDVAMSLHNLARLYYSQERYSEAEPLYIKALKIAEDSLGMDHPNTVTIRKSLELLRDKIKDEF